MARERLVSELGVIGACEQPGTSLASASTVVFAVKPQQMREAARSCAPARLQRARREHRRRHPHRRSLALAGWPWAHRARHAQYAGPRAGRGHGPLRAALRGRRRSQVGRIAAVRGGRGALVRPRGRPRRGDRGLGQRPRLCLLCDRGARAGRARAGACRGRVAHRSRSRRSSGAAKLAVERGEDPAVLRAQVTSKGGTTERALEVLEEAQVKREFVDAVKAPHASDRASWARRSERICT